MPEEKSKSKIELSVPAAIIIAGIFISIAILISRAPDVSPRLSGDSGQDQIEPTPAADIVLRATSSSDHIRGSLSAPVKIVVFSDPECPFCKRFHSTMTQLIDSYGGTNKVAWIYRHFPLDALHLKARKESEALECANELGGGGKFWEYLDRLMAVTPSNDQLELSELGEIAKFVKLDGGKFQTCLDSGKYADKIQKDVDDATLAGGRGTPYAVIISANGKKYPIDGAVSLDSLKASVDVALRDK